MVCCFFFLMTRRPPTFTLFPYTTLFRSHSGAQRTIASGLTFPTAMTFGPDGALYVSNIGAEGHGRSEEHTSELQSHGNLVCRLLLEKKKRKSSFERRAMVLRRRSLVGRG